MLQIRPRNELLASVELFQTVPEQQQALLSELSQQIATRVDQQTGCFGGAIHRSLDGRRVMNYLQWTSVQAYQDCMAAELATELAVEAPERGAIARCRLDARLYEVVISLPADADLKFQPGRFLHVGEVRSGLPDDPVRILERQREICAIALQHPDLLSLNFHRAIDGSRTLSFGFWQTFKNFRWLVKQDRFKPIKRYWRGLAEHEFYGYEVTSLFEH
jgi:hypothetical protein